MNEEEEKLDVRDYLFYKCLAENSDFRKNLYNSNVDEVIGKEAVKLLEEIVFIVRKIPSYDTLAMEKIVAALEKYHIDCGSRGSVTLKGISITIR